jgi:KUP system potassium uptake protein
VPGTAVFLSRVAQPVPLLLVRHVTQLGAIQERIVSLTVAFEEVPRVPLAERVEVNQVADGFWHVVVHFGFVEVPSIPAAIDAARDCGCPIAVEDATYFGGHDDVVPKQTRPRLPAWRRALFGFMYRNAVRTPETFYLPRDRFLEIGRQVDI